MAVVRTRTITLIATTGRVIEVEADVGHGQARFHLIGLSDTHLPEIRDRVRAATINSSLPWPKMRTTVSLYPASLPKSGTQLDLSIAVAILAATGVIPAARIAATFFLGELGLDGRIRPIRGVLPAVLGAAATGDAVVVVPTANASEAALVPGVQVVPADDLQQLVTWLRDDRQQLPPIPASVAPPSEPEVDLADIAGQAQARKALEISAAGGHHLLTVGPNGSGTTMLAERLATLLPDVEPQDAYEVTALHSIAGALPPHPPLMNRPPFISAHHTASPAAIFGGGRTVARPGVCSLAHHGIRFLDEAPELPRSVLDGLRQPLDAGQVTIARSAGTLTFPARFILVLATTPCPCSVPADVEHSCQCSTAVRRRHLARLSGALGDRIAITVALTPPRPQNVTAPRERRKNSRAVAERVMHARRRAAQRSAATPWRTNAEIPASALHSDFGLSDAALKPIAASADRGALSARGADQILRIAWTLADLTGKPAPDHDDVAAALALHHGDDIRT
ncbi:YifB family Mg chelatase-like AAA ATPase [Nonomuraea ceibae]|uniref:YifB family Mg chelatase-like AAA ATPase n=1 Tax=Nonomuraea ceibae TaxID=1935170 RepID=UPI001C601287|nr:YifB family Mg chelatase-like AAA ATPase [Nonomuraea ceibae]